MKSRHLFHIIMFVCLLAFAMAIVNIIYQDIALSFTIDAHATVSNAAYRKQPAQAPDYSFQAFWNQLPDSTRAQVPYCELPSSDVQHSDIEASHPIRCANTGQLPTSTQSDIWTTYEMWLLCHKYDEKSACYWLLN